MAESSDTASELQKALPDLPPNLNFKKRVGQFDQYYDSRTFATKLRKSFKQKKERESKYAILIRRIMDERGHHYKTAIDIKSAKLCNVLLKINEAVEGFELDRSKPEATPELMYYSYRGLKEHLAEEEKKEMIDEELICDINAAIFYVEEHLGGLMKDMELVDSHHKISFDVVWALFFPNSFVYSYHINTAQDTVLMVRSSQYTTRTTNVDEGNGTRQLKKTRCLEVICDIIHDDGNNFGLAKRVLHIDEYPGTRSITSLSVYPLKYHNDKDGVYSRAVELGKLLVNLDPHCFRQIEGQASRRIKHCETGPTSVDASRRVDRGDTEPIFVDGRVMISPFAYTRFHSIVSPMVHKALEKDRLKDDQYAICSPVLMGFAFDGKIWGEFPLTRARIVDWNDGAFDALVLGQKQKELIRALVRQHANKEAKFDDIVKGKGQGLIGLLAGTPGCGKTLTAEAVAEVTHKPLYVLSAGELGITPTSLESTLVSVLELCQMWNAVLLLDEAEVFLTKRSTSDLERNALVSIFLRRLEYYRGILILTTNLPELADPAFESRIHFSIYYPELDSGSRKAIWATFFKRNSIDISDKELCRLASHRINGRQIKNSFSIALAIAPSKRSHPGEFLKHIDLVLGVLNDWGKASQKMTNRGPPVEYDGDTFY